MKYHVQFDLDLVKNPYKGVFIALEGLDASGKSTQTELIYDKLSKLGKTVTKRHPFEGEIGQFVRSILSGKKKLDRIAMQYLINANRQSQQQAIKEQLEKGNIVIIDRYIWSAPVYALVDKGLDFDNADAYLCALDVLSTYNSFIMPDTTFFLNISTSTAISRMNKQNKKKEIYENEEAFQKISKSYDWVTDRFKEEFTVIDGEKAIEEVTSEIMEKVEKISKQKK